MGFVMAMTAPIEILYAHRFGAGNVAITAFVMISSVGLITVDLFGTRFVPRLEPRASITAGMAGFALASLLMGVAQSFPPLLIARALQGTSAALLQGALLQAAVRTSDSRERALGALNSAVLLGGAIGAPAGGIVANLLAGTAGFRLAFGMCAALGVLTSIGIWTCLPSLPTNERPELGLPRLSGSSVMGLALVLGMLGYYLRSGVVNTALPLVGAEHHLSTAVIGIALGALAGVQIVTLRFADRLFARFAADDCLVVGLVVGIVASALLIVAHGWAAFTVAAMLFGFLVAVAMVGPPLVIMSLSPDASTGLASYRIACGVGSLAGSTSINATVAATGAAGALSMIGGVLLGGIALVGLIGRRLAEL